MQQVARTARGWSHWTGRVLPVLAVALLAIGPAHAKDKKKKKHDAEVATQVESPVRGERAAPPESPPMMGKESKEAKAPPPVQSIREPSRPVSLDRVIEQVERRYKAKVIKQDTKQKGDRLVYELKLLSDDKLRTIRIDAETGKEL